MTDDDDGDDSVEMLDAGDDDDDEVQFVSETGAPAIIDKKTRFVVMRPVDGMHHSGGGSGGGSAPRFGALPPTVRRLTVDQTKDEEVVKRLVQRVYGVRDVKVSGQGQQTQWHQS